MPIIRLKITRTHQAMLEVLGRALGLEERLVEGALEHLLERIDDGVHRPGAWEAQVVAQLFGRDWTGEMEPDPSRTWRLRLPGVPASLFGPVGQAECYGIDLDAAVDLLRDHAAALDRLPTSSHRAYLERFREQDFIEAILEEGTER